jgi:hypothetical protein
MGLDPNPATIISIFGMPLALGKLILRIFFESFRLDWDTTYSGGRKQ